MPRPFIASLLAFCLLIGYSCPAMAQSNSSESNGFRFDGRRGSLTPKWEATRMPGNLSSLDMLPGAIPLFTGASYDPLIQNLPYRDVLVSLERGETLELVQVESFEEEESTQDWFATTSKGAFKGRAEAWYPAKAAVIGQREIRQGKHYQHLRIYPMRVHRSGQRISKAREVQFQIKIVNSGSDTYRASQKNYAAHSVLASGTWFKLGVLRDGIYKIDYNSLTEMGLNPAEIDPRSFRIYGNGGHMLPQEAGAFPHDDLVENSVWVAGQADGRFDQGDYLLFFGSSPHQWNYYPKLDRWAHQRNVYSDTSFYFMTFGQGIGKRISKPADPGAVTYNPNGTDQFLFKEKDAFSPLKSGRFWLGESFDLTPSKTVDLPYRRRKSGENIKLTLRTAARSQVVSNFALRGNGIAIGTMNLGAISFEGYGNWYSIGHRTFSLTGSQFSGSSGNIALEMTYSKPQVSSVGYLDFVELNYRANLDLANAQSWSFVARENVGAGQVFGYSLGNANSGHRIWDVTDATQAREMELTFSGGTASFKVLADTIRQFYAFDANGVLPPQSIQRINSQDLHGLPQAEFLIVTSDLLAAEANRLAEFHRNRLGQSVHVVRTSQIFNEFGSGRKDPAALRDFVKMFYDRWQDNGGVQPSHLLLFGDGGYDYRNISHAVEAGEVLTYQSRSSQAGNTTYTSDDFFGFLDDGEGFWGEYSGFASGADEFAQIVGDTFISAPGLDIAIGRMPVQNLEEARNMVNKVIGYKTDPEGLGNWRNRLVLVADHRDDDGNLHAVQANGYPGIIEANDPCINVDKLYMDNYQMTTTASGVQFPEGKDALLRGLDEGSLLVNYTGHGGEVAWSDASILTISEINSLRNGVRLPAFVTATCEFGRWDDPARRSGAELLVLNPDGGAIAMFTTLRVVYSNSNEVLNRNFYRKVFKRHPIEDRMMTLGEVYMETKNASWQGGAINNRKFCLLGDPAIKLAYPELQARVTKINGIAVQPNVVDTLGTLNLVTIEGEVLDRQGNLATDFSGDLSAVVFDKPGRFTTQRAPLNFFWQKNRVFNGKASISQGRFSFQFVVPQDVTYESGKGKISLYAENGQLDGGGCHLEIYPGGSGGTPIVDDESPELTLFMNDEKFVDGGLVGDDPVLLAEVFDENGLNTVGTGIGHELSAVLDGNSRSPIVLNEYYEASANSYKEGRIRYPFFDLDDGAHELEVKVWDVANNSANGKVGFVVADDARMALGHVLNYPNPFSTNTKFYLEHNLNGQLLDLRVRIYTVSGRLVKTLNDSFFADGNLYCDLEWDGLDEYGDRLGRGVYVYQVELSNPSQAVKVNRFEKMVLLR